MRTMKVSKKLAGMALFGTLFWTACSTAWVTEAEKIVTALIPAVANLLTLMAAVQGNATAADVQMVQSAGSEVGADLQLIESLIKQYEKADAAAKPGLLDEMQASIEAVQSCLNGLLGSLHIKDAGTQAKVTAVVGILLGEVQSVAGLLPASQMEASTSAKRAFFKQPAEGIPLTANQFVASYNATMTAKTGQPELDHATARLQIHLHGKLVRWASMGCLE